MFWNHVNVGRCLNSKAVFVFKNLVKTCFVEGKNGDYYLTYHGSKIITYHPDNSFTLSSCGFRTKTTKHRLNEFGPVKVFQKNNDWFIKTPTGSVIFFDGIRVDSFGNIWEDQICCEDFDGIIQDDELGIWTDRDEYAQEMTIDNQIEKTYL